MRSHRLFCVLAALAFAHMLVFEVGPGGVDGWCYYAMTESLLTDGDLDLSNNNHGGAAIPWKDGRQVTQYPPGAALLDAPFFGAALAAERAVSLPPPDLGRRGQEPPYDAIPPRVLYRSAAIVFGHNLYTLAGLLLLYLAILELGLPANAAAWGAALAYFGTPMQFYGQTGMSEPLSFFFACWAFWLWARHAAEGPSPDPWRPLRLGLVCGLAVLVHYRNIVLPAAFLGALWAERRNPGRRAQRLLNFLAGGAIPAILLLTYHALAFGNLRPDYGQKLTSPFATGAPFNVWFSQRHGFFLYHPLLLLGAAGLALTLWRRSGPAAPQARAAAGISAGIFLLHSLLSGSYPEWDAGGGFSNRYLLPTIPFLAVGLALFIARRGWDWKLKAAAAACVAWSTFLFLASFSYQVYDTDGARTGRRVADSLYAFKEGVPPAVFLRNVAERSHLLRWLFLRG